jgi:hypothetical protein
MPLRLSAEGAKAAGEWRSQRCRSPAGEQLAAGVLKAIAGRRWQLWWAHYASPAGPDLITIQPRGGLFIHVRLPAGGEQEEFTVVAVTGTGAAGDE